MPITPTTGNSFLMPSPIPDFIYLASQSPRRSQLLDQLGVRHALLLPDADEDSEALEVVLRNEAPKTYVQRVTALKLQAAQQRLVRRNLQTAPILCADTTVAMGQTIFGKPQDAEDAKRMLRALSNRPHRVGKAGAYAVQGKAAAHIAHMSGSYSGIMGLPLFETAQALRSLGFRI